MNSLSWLVYVTQVVSSLNNLGGVLIGAAVITGVILLLGWGISEGDFNPKPYIKWPIISAFLGILLVVFVPTQRTMLLIASSEIGERVVNNPKIQGMVDPSVDLLKNWIANENKKVLKELNKDK